MRRLLCLCCLLTVLVTVGAWSQETESTGPKPMIWVVPHLQFDRESGPADLFSGLDTTLALPLTPRSHVTATYHWRFDDENQLSALFNYDQPLARDTILRGSAGLIRDDVGFGLTLHRSYGKYGVGVFAQSIDSDIVGGLMLTRTVPWGAELGGSALQRRSENSEWSSGAGNVGELGASAALEYSRGQDRGEFATTTAYFPRWRASWTREGRSAQSGSTTALEFAPPLSEAWTYATEGPLNSSVAIVNGVVYAGSADGWLYALDVRSGQRLWRFPASTAITGAPAVMDRHVFFGTESGEVFCVAQPEKDGPPAGRLVWRYRVGAAVTASPLISDSGLLLVGAADSYVYALDRFSGKLAWRISTGGPVLASASKIARRIPAGVDAAGLATTKRATAIIAGTDGKLYAIEEVRGQVIWTFTTDGPITGAPVISGDRVYVGNRSGTLYALDAANGRQLWSFKSLGSINEAPAVDEQRVYVAGAEGALWGLDRNTGKALWQVDVASGIVSSPTIVRGNYLYAASRDGSLSAFDATSGRQLWTSQRSQVWSTPPAIADGHMILGDEKGALTAFLPGEGVAVPKPATAAKPANGKVQGAASRPSNGTTPPAVPAKPPTPEKPEKPVVPTVVVANPEPNAPIIPAQPGTGTPLPPTGSRPAGATAPVAVPPTPGVPLPPDKPVTPVTPDKPVTPVTPDKPVTPPTPDKPVIPVTPATPDKPVTPVTPNNPVKPPVTDFPPPTTPDKPVTPVTPDKPVTPVKPATPLAKTAALMTLLITPADGRVPVMLCNQNSLHVGGKIAVGSDVVRVRVNGIETPIRNAEYGTQVTFPGPGVYQIVVEAEDRQGGKTPYRRTVWVLEGKDAVSTESMEFGQRGGSFIASFLPGIRDIDFKDLRKVIELRNNKDQLVRTWSMLADVNEAVNWNGADAAGKAMPAGDYTVVYLLVDGSGGILASLTQPMQLRD